MTPGIVIIPDVATPEMCEAIQAHLPPCGHRRQEPIKALGPEAQELRQRCWEWTVQIHAEPLFPDLSLVVISAPGDAMVRHCDNVRQASDGTWLPNHTPWRIATSLLYLTSCDGGALNFPELGVRISPQPGLFVTFPCGRGYAHEVLPVTAGLRYSLPMWYTTDPARKEHA